MIGVDVGQARVGVARCDPDRVLALPVATVKRTPWGGHVDAVADYVAEYGAEVVLVGLPRHLGGGLGEAASMALAFASDLKELVDVEIRMVDERLTTVAAHQALREAGVPGRKQRAVVDQLAAVIMVEQALDTVRRTGQLPGVVPQAISRTYEEETE